jgi:hypothetical protein
MLPVLVPKKGLENELGRGVMPPTSSGEQEPGGEDLRILYLYSREVQLGQKQREGSFVGIYTLLFWCHVVRQRL